jgi:hypothetical protein
MSVVISRNGEKQAEVYVGGIFFKCVGNEFSNGRFKTCGNYGVAEEIRRRKLNWVCLY